MDFVHTVHEVDWKRQNPENLYVQAAQAPNSSNWKTLPDEPTYLARVMYSYFTLRI